MKENDERVILIAGDEFGEKSLEGESAKRTATVKAVTSCKLISIGKREITEALGASVKNIILKNRVRIALEKSKIFRSLVSKSIEELMEGVEVREIKKD